MSLDIREYKKSARKDKVRLKAGVMLSVMGIIAWGFISAAVVILAKILNIEVNVNWMRFLLLPVTLVILSLLAAYFDIGKRFGVRHRYISYGFLLMHAIWGANVTVLLPEALNGYVMLVISFLGIAFVNSMAGFVGTITIGLSNLGIYLMFLNIYGFSVGMDEKALFFFFGVTSLWAGLFNENAKKIRNAHRKLGSKLEQAYYDLQNLDKQKSNFFQNISHELRTPLTLILNPIEKLQAKYPDDENMKFLSKNSKKLYRLVNHLLDFQRLSAKKETSRLPVVDLRGFLDISAKFFKKSTERRCKTFIYDDGGISTADIKCELDFLEKIVFNLLSNAIKYTDDEGEIHMSLSRDEDHFRLTVKDNGKGICEEKLKLLFMVFTSLNEEDKGKVKYESAGVGLALVKEAVDCIGARIGVESVEGEGSTFYVDFPAVKMKSVVDFVFIDDEKEIIEDFEELFLSRQKITNFKVCESAAEAREIFKESKVKCVLSDIFMPGENGVDFLTYVLSTEPLCKRMMLTGNPNAELLQQAINSGVAEHIFYKPMEYKKIFEKVEQLVKESEVVEDIVENLSAYSPKNWLLYDSAEEPITAESIREKRLSVASSEPLVLIVDDLSDMRRLVAQTLLENDYRIEMAVDGRDALTLMSSGKCKPDLVVTDWKMPVMTGLELIEEMINDENLSDIPIVLLTAKDDNESILLGTKTGANAYIGKPFSEIELVSTIENLLRLQKKSRIIEDLKKAS